MPISNKTYILSPMKQLIDLNGDITNFDLSFTATTKDGSPFEALVVDQTSLDSNPTLEYKKAEGTISGNIIADKGVYQNYFLLLKSKNPVECNVTIEIKEIAQQRNPEQKRRQFSLSEEQKSKSTINWNLVGILIIGCCILLWYFYGNKNSSSDNIQISPSPSPSLQQNKEISSFNLDESNNTIKNSDLLERLKKLEIDSKK